MRRRQPRDLVHLDGHRAEGAGHDVPPELVGHGEGVRVVRDQPDAGALRQPAGHVVELVDEELDAEAVGGAGQRGRARGGAVGRVVEGVEGEAVAEVGGQRLVPQANKKGYQKC